MRVLPLLHNEQGSRPLIQFTPPVIARPTQPPTELRGLWFEPEECRASASTSSKRSVRAVRLRWASATGSWDSGCGWAAGSCISTSSISTRGCAAAGSAAGPQPQPLQPPDPPVDDNIIITFLSLRLGTQEGGVQESVLYGAEGWLMRPRSTSVWRHPHTGAGARTREPERESGSAP